MHRLLLNLFLSLSFFTANAQVGISGSYLSGQADNWEFTFPTTRQPSISLPGTGWQAGVDYWFRLKNIRIEFLPTLAYSQQQQDLKLDLNNFAAEMKSLHFFFNTNLYLFDFKGDCDCPTFSKEGPSLQKGVFLQISPGYSYFKYTLSEQETETLLETTDNQFSLGLALGFDLGLSDLITITPQIGGRYYANAKWDTLDNGSIDNSETGVASESSLLQYTAGIRLGLRFE